jgi:uncharacterized protein involved in response to NO
MKNRMIFDYPLFALGFRPFFMLAGLSGLLLILLWNAIFKGILVAENYYPSAYWHAHEMLLGYGGAVIAGFLLTAVKNWTGKPTLTGDKLAGLCLLWLYGRIVPFYAGLLPDFLIALIDLAFLPILAYHITKPIMETKQNQNFIFTGLLLLLITGNVFVHCEMLGLKPNTSWFGLRLIVATVIVLILVMAGRVFPFFTERGLPGTLAIRNPQLDNWSVASAVLVFGIQLFGISGTVLALSALMAVIVNCARVAGWYVQKIWYVPLLWVLYVGYGWIIFGFALTALSAYTMIQPSLALHAFTIGGIGTLTLGMMARVALGHTGRALRASNAIAFAFMLINVAAFFRVVLPIAFPNWYQTLIYGSTLAWFVAFLLFIFVYGPIMVSQRIDGQSG